MKQHNKQKNIANNRDVANAWMTGKHHCRGGETYPANNMQGFVDHSCSHNDIDNGAHSKWYTLESYIFFFATKILSVDMTMKPKYCGRLRCGTAGLRFPCWLLSALIRWLSPGYTEAKEKKTHIYVSMDIVAMPCYAAWIRVVYNLYFRKEYIVMDGTNPCENSIRCNPVFILHLLHFPI